MDGVWVRFVVGLTSPLSQQEPVRDYLFKFTIREHDVIGMEESKNKKKQHQTQTEKRQKNKKKKKKCKYRTENTHRGRKIQ